MLNCSTCVFFYSMVSFRVACLLILLLILRSGSMDDPSVGGDTQVSAKVSFLPYSRLLHLTFATTLHFWL